MNGWRQWLVVPTTCAAIAAGYAFASIDFILLAAMLLMPVALACLMGIGVALAVRKKRPSKVVSVAITSFAVIVLLPPLLLASGAPMRDYARFAIWSSTHPAEMQIAKRSSEVLMHLDGWGFAGNDNDDYLVSDPSDSLDGAVMPTRQPVLPDAKFSIAHRWSSSLHLPCDPVWVRRVRHAFYVVTTYDCEMSTPATS